MSKVCDLVLKAQYILTQNKSRDILEDAYLAISNGLIIDIGLSKDLDWQADQHMDLSNAMLMPGLCNAHTHAAMTFLRGLADDLPLMDWLNNYIFPVEQHLSPEIVEISSLLACAEMLRTGTTAFVDMYLYSNSVAKSVNNTGMKALLGEVIFAFPSPAYKDIDAALQLVADMHADWRNKSDKRIRVAVMPHTVYTTNMEILKACAKLSKDLDLPIHIHAAETVEETKNCLNIYGLRPVEICHQAGILGPNTSIAHAVDLRKAEIELLRQTECKVAHNPKSNFKLSSGCAPVPQMLAAGIKIGLGTDGAASNNSLNMFSEMNFCALAHKGISGNPALMSAQEVLDMATIGSASAMMSSSFGSIAIGMDADIIALDLSSANMQPMYNPVSHAVYAASGNEVCMTMVNGNILYKDGNYLTLDYPDLLKEVAKIAKWVKGRINKRSTSLS